jgi:hypothetical protein
VPRFFFLLIVRSGHLAVAAISGLLLTALTLQLSSTMSFSGFLPLRAFLLRRGRRHPCLDLFVDLLLKSFIVSCALEKLYAKKLKTDLVSVKDITQHGEIANLFATIILRQSGYPRK